jgi:8-oxo-dGTP diphosphatase
MTDKIRVVAIAFFRTTDQRYLLCRRGPAESGAGSWEFPGGKIDAGETEKVALVREIQEELCVEVSEKQLVYVSEHFHQYSTKHVHIYLFKYDVEEIQFKLVDHDQAEWVLLSEMLNYQLAAADIPFIEKLKLI